MMTLHLAGDEGDFRGVYGKGAGDKMDDVFWMTVGF
jgi:hypothetical protein